jgi:hypothetical protein
MPGYSYTNTFREHGMQYLNTIAISNVFMVTVHASLVTNDQINSSRVDFINPFST